MKADILSNENREIVDFRNLLIHNYFGIDAQEILETIEDDFSNFS